MEGDNTSKYSILIEHPRQNVESYAENADMSREMSGIEIYINLQ